MRMTEQEMDGIQSGIFVTEPKQQGNYGNFYFLHGVAGSGKTTRLEKWKQEWQESLKRKCDISCVLVSLSGMKHYRECFLTLFRNCTEQNVMTDMPVAATDAYQFFAENRDPFLVEDEELEQKMDTLLNFYSERNIHVIFCIDDFEKLLEIAPKEEERLNFFSLLYSLTPKLRVRSNVSVLLVSELLPERFLCDTELVTKFEQAYRVCLLEGFTEPEMEQYFESYGEKQPLENQKERINHYCGRNPMLLMELRRLILLYGAKDYDVDAIYEQHGELLQAGYERIYGSMERAGVAELYRSAFVEEKSGRVSRVPGIILMKRGLAVQGTEGAEKWYYPSIPQLVEYVRGRMCRKA